MQSSFFLYYLQIPTENTSMEESKAQIPRIKVLIQMGTTFLLVCIGWVLFRSEKPNQRLYSLKRDRIVESLHPAPKSARPTFF